MKFIGIRYISLPVIWLGGIACSATDPDVGEPASCSSIEDPEK